MLRLNLSRLRWRAFAAWAARSAKVRRALPHVKVLLGAEAGFEVAPVKDVLLAWARRQRPRRASRRCDGRAPR